MGCKHRQKRLFPDVSDLAPKARKTLFKKVRSQRAHFLYIAAPRASMRTLLQSYSAHKPREPRRSVFPVLFLSFMQDLARRYRCPRWSRRLHGAFLFFFRVPTLFLAGRSFFLIVSHCDARHAARMHARLLARARTTDERTMRRAVPAGVADWITARGGDTERTLTAAAPPPPRDPYRHALAMRPSLRARPLVS